MDFDQTKNKNKVFNPQPNNSIFHKSLELIKTKNLTQLESVIEAVAKPSTDSPDYLYVKSHYHFLMHEYDKAHSVALKYYSAMNGDFESLGSIYQAEINYILARCFEIEKKYEQAKKYYEKSYQLNKSNIKNIEHYAGCLKRTDSDKAVIFLEDALQNNNDCFEIESLLATYKDKVTISACMIVKNEEQLLPDCLESIRNIVNEIIIVDTGSNDKTKEIALAYGAKIYAQDWEGDFSKHRNYSIEKANSDWILIIDADERLDSSNLRTLKDLKNSSSHSIINFRVKNVDSQLGKISSSLNSVRMFKKDLNLKYNGIVHNKLMIPPEAKVTNSDLSIIHLGYHLAENQMLEKFKRTMSLLEKQVASEPENGFYLFNYCQQLKIEETLTEIDNTDKIINSALKTIELVGSGEGDNFHIYLMSLIQLAQAYPKKELFDKAIECCRNALKAKPDYLDAIMELGFIYSQMEEYDKSVYSFKEYVKKQKQFDLLKDAGSLILWHTDSRIIAYRNLGLIYEMKKDYASAETNYRRVLNINPVYDDINVCMARIAYNQGFTKKAEHYFTIQLEKANTNLEAYLGLIKISVDNKDFSGAEELVEKALEDFPKDKSLKSISDNLSKKKYLLDSAIINKNDLSQLLSHAGKEFKRQNYNEVINLLTAYKNKLKDIPKRERVEIDRLLAFSYCNIGQWKESEFYLNDGLDKAPNSLDFNYLKAFISLNLIEHENVIEYGDKYLELYAKYEQKGFPIDDMAISSEYVAQLYNMLGVSYAGSNNIEMAEKYYELAIEKNKINPLPYQNYAWLLKHFKTDQEALQIISDGIKNCENIQELEMMKASYSKRPSITACMMVKNEEELLPGCLDSIRDWVNEIVIVDTGSTDKTIEIAESYRAKIFHQPWEGNFSKHRNYSIEQATSDWIFIIDADERIETKDVPKLLEIISNDKTNVIAINVFNCYRETGIKVTSANSTRFFRRGLGCKYEGIVHNQLYIPENLTIERAPVSLEHLGYDLSKDKMIDKFNRTKKLLEIQLEENQDNAFAWYNLAQLLRGKLFENKESLAPQIIEAAKKAVALTKPNEHKERFIHLMALDQLAWTYFYTEQYDKAKKYAKQALKHKSNYLDPIMLMGHVSVKKEDYQEAIKRYEEFLEIQKNYDEHREIDPLTLYHLNSPETAYFALGNIYELQKDIDSAIKYFKKTYEANSEYLDTAFQIGRLCFSQNNLIEAERYLLLESEKENPHTKTYAALANLYQQQGRNDKAEDNYTKALALDQKSHILKLQAAEFYSAINNFEKAYKILSQNSKLKNNIEIFTKLADVCFKLSKYEEAKEYYLQALEVNPDSPQILNDLGNCEFKLRKNKQAEKYYKLALENNNADSSTLLNLGINYISMEQPQKAIETLKNYLIQNPKDYDISILIGNIQKESGDYKSAISSYEQVLTQNPDNIEILLALSDCYLFMGQGDAAVTGYGRILKLNPNFEPVKARLKELEQITAQNQKGNLDTK